MTPIPGFGTSSSGVPAEKSLRTNDVAPTVKETAPSFSAIPTTPAVLGDATVPPLPLRQLAIAATAGLALTAAPETSMRARAADPALAAAPVNTAAMDELRKQVADLKAELKTVQDGQKASDTLLYGRTDSSNPNDGMIRILKSIETKLSDLTLRMDQMEAKVSALGKTTVGSSPVAGIPTPMSPPPVSSPSNPPMSSSRSVVRIVNEYPVEVSLLINAKSYRVPPNDVRNIDVTAGSYTYELLQSGAQPVTSTIRDGETVTLRIR
jgi:hypothetical protein